MINLLYLFFSLLIGINLFAQEDHTDYIEGSFSSPQKITTTCLECHEDVDKDIMKTRHWNWLGDEFTTKHGEKIKLGKVYKLSY